MNTALRLMAISLAVAACGLVADTYQCRITETTSYTGAALNPTYLDFTFTPTQETDTYLAGPAPGAGRTSNGDVAFIMMSKLDGKFGGMYVERAEGGTMNAGFCRKQ